MPDFISTFQLALSLLHSKAEEEISNTHELISEKETELHEAEEIFSGLTEVLHAFFYSSVIGLSFGRNSLSHLAIDWVQRN